MVRFRQRARKFSLLLNVQTILGLTQPRIKCALIALSPESKRVRGVMLATHLNPVPVLRISGAPFPDLLSCSAGASLPLQS